MKSFLRSTVGGVAMLSAAYLLSIPANAAGTNAFTALPGSLSRTIDLSTGELNAPRMTVEVVLQPRNQSQLHDLLERQYNNGGSSAQWLQRGQFVQYFGPTTTQRAAVAAYLRASGLTVVQTANPFLVRAVGSSRTIASAFRTDLRTYKNKRGIAYFQNATAVQVPASLASGVVGVLGLSNTIRPHPQISRPTLARNANGLKPGVTCTETSYPTFSDIVNLYVNGVGFTYGWGAAPGCNGLSPSQVNSIYGAPPSSGATTGTGVNVSVFELSGYTQSDITTWAQTWFGGSYTPPIVNVLVDGGPVSPDCPSGDTCFPGYGGDIEVNADIEMTLAMAPNVANMYVYNAPNDDEGITSLDEYTKIASDNLASTMSSSWGLCENDTGAAYAAAENIVFTWMAAQGQSSFGAAGDTGAFGCIRDDGTTEVNVGDPPVQPWVTSVGGTSFQTYNPGTSPTGSYPVGVESVWNVWELCNNSSNSQGTGFPGSAWCGATGAGGGGSSQFWVRPNWQRGPGVINSFAVTGCTMMASFGPMPTGATCRQVPDMSANADEWTPYGEYCTGTDPTSSCATISGSPAGWFGIGGTSLSSPLVAAVFGDRNGFQGKRTGNANPLLYLWGQFRRGSYFYDITGVGQISVDNGLFPTTNAYDEATGWGTPKISAIIESR